MKTFVVELKQEDYEQLHRLHYLHDAYINLLARLNAIGVDQSVYDRFLNEYCDNFIKYENFKQHCTDVYMPETCDPQKTSWNADFNNETLVFTEND